MKNLLALIGLMIVSLPLAARAAPPPPDDGKLRIIAFGAHPDDAEICAGGAGALWAAQGHHVKLVSVTNGDIGHWRDAGGPLAQRRIKEVAESSRILGTVSEVLDNHDGELMPTLEVRKQIIRQIREWKADIVLSPRPYDYHPDHRNTSILVQDAAYMVTVPFICPDVPYLKNNPVFMYYTDRFQKPYPAQPDIVISLDSVIDKQLDALVAITSQFVEGGANGNVSLVPKNDEERKRREAQVRASFANRYRGIASQYHKELGEWYGDEQAKNTKYAFAYEICEYGRRPSKDELKKLFPFFQKQ